MKLVRIKNKQGIIVSDNNIPTDLDYFLNENISINTWGKPERWILKDSEPYEESDILETEERIDQLTEDVTTWVKLKSEYTIEIEDITDQLNKENRIKELKKLLSESDFRMTTDYFKRMSLENQTYWDETRESWRQELRSLGV
jgi:hypothetical protein